MAKPIIVNVSYADNETLRALSRKKIIVLHRVTKKDFELTLAARWGTNKSWLVKAAQKITG